MRKGFLFVIGSVALGFFLLSSANTAGADQSTKLIDLLIKKGIVTREEAEDLKKEAMDEEKRQPARAAAEQAAGAASQAADWTNKMEVGYKDGGYIKTTDDRFSLKLNVGVQPLFIYEELDDEEDDSSFRIRRARLYASGNALYPWLRYDTQITLEGGSVALRDAYLEAAYLDYLRPRVGQYKVPYDREYLNSGFALQFIERSIASNQFSLQRDIGFQLSGSLLGERASYAVGVFNGSGGNQDNVDTDYMYVGRLVWEPFGPYPYAQPSLGTKKDPLFALGVAAGYLPGLDRGERRSLAGSLGNADIVPIESDVFQFAADLAFKYKRFSTEAGYHFREIDPQGASAFPSADAWGMYVQAGYFLLRDKLEFAARYAYVDPDNPTGTGTERQHEYTAGLNYYFYVHRIKAQLNYSYFETDDEPQDRNDHTIQTTMVFLF